MVSLFLMTEKGFDVLNAILNNNYHSLIDKVIIGKDNNLVNDYHEEILKICVLNKLNYQYYSETSEIQSDFAFAVSWRWLININQNTKLVVLHDSLLPKYRGFSPLVNALIQGENEVGVTALIASEKYDEGPIIAQEKLEISYPIKIQEAIKKVTKCYVQLILNLLHKIKNNIKLTEKPQEHGNASYSLWRDENDYKLDWRNSSEYLERFINAVGYPYKGASSLFNNSQVIIEEVEQFFDVEIVNRDAGKVIFIEDGYPIVVCGSGLLKIKKAYYLVNGKNILPLKKFRSRFS